MVLYGVSLRPGPCDNAYRHTTRLETYDTGIDQPTHDFIASRAGSQCRHHPHNEILVSDCPIHGGSLFGSEIPAISNPIAKKAKKRRSKSKRRKSRSKRRKSRSRKRKVL